MPPGFALNCGATRRIFADGDRCTDAATLWGLVKDQLVSGPHFAPVWSERLREIGARHKTTLFPLPEQTKWILDEVLLSADFYAAECLPRIESAAESRRCTEDWVLTRITCEGASELVARIRSQLATRGDDPQFAERLLDVYATWRQLEAIISCAFVGNPFEPQEIGVNLDQAAERTQSAWGLMAFLHSPHLIGDIVNREPRLMFIVGSYPAQLPLAMAYAEQVRRVLPRALLVLYQSDMDLYSSFAQTMPDLTQASRLFEFVDGVTVYADIQDLTLCQLVDRLSNGGSSLAGIENLVCKADGRVVYRAPSPDTIAEYLRHTHLDNLYDALSPGDGLCGPPLFRPAKLSPTITAAKQTCYWDRCHFCPTAAQSWIQCDTELERRAVEVSDKIVALAVEGAEMTFVGREVVPPSVLRSMVEQLSNEPRGAFWSFEGKFETFYDGPYIERLATAGCRGIIFGLDSPSDWLNQPVDKHRPGISVAKIEQIIALMDAAGISVHVNTIFDLPGATSEDFEKHKRWLAQMFDKHRLFHFNTNSLLVLPGSRMAEHPAEHGLEVDASAGNLPLCLPFRKSGASPVGVGPSHLVWTEVFGSNWYRGCLLEQLHSIYHESTACSFSDAVQGKNHFKTIRAEIKALIDPYSLHLGLVESVQVVAAEDNDRYVWLIDVGGPGSWVRLPERLWRILETSIENDLALDAAIARTAPTLTS